MSSGEKIPVLLPDSPPTALVPNLWTHEGNLRKDVTPGTVVKDPETVRVWDCTVEGGVKRG